MADGHGGGGHKQRARIAYSGEERGFGAGAVEDFLLRAQKAGISDGGTDAVSGARPQELNVNRAMRSYDFGHGVRQPLRTKEQAMMAVKAHTADYAVVPFHHPYYGYDFETLRALASQITLFGVEQIADVSSDDYVLAVYEPQVLDFVQGSHPGSSLSTIMAGTRHLWARSGDAAVALNGVHKLPDGSGYLPTPEQQYLLRDRVDVIFASPLGARACKSKLDGFRQAGVKVEETLETIEPHRDFARRARTMLDDSRQTSTTFDFGSGEARMFSVMPNGRSQARKLYAMVVPRSIGLGPEYMVIDDHLSDAEPGKTRFMAVEYNPDLTLFEDAYRTTDAKTRYWMKRIRGIVADSLRGAHSPAGEVTVTPTAVVASLAGMAVAAIGAAGLLGWRGFPLLPTSSDIAFIGDLGAFLLGFVLIAYGFSRVSVPSGGLGSHAKGGVRMLLAFQRAGQAASIGDVENFLRNFGVRHQVVRIDDDSEGHHPAAAVLDIEFMADDLEWNPSRRLRGAVVNGALKKAFARWKSRGVMVLAAMPFDSPQMPAHKTRHWLWNAPIEWAKDFTETFFIRLSRILFYLVPAALLIYFIFRMWSDLAGK
jgi:hypothetical protein